MATDLQQEDSGQMPDDPPGEVSRPQSWLDFWNGSNFIYVSLKHLVAHHQQLLADLAPLLPERGAVVLDYGCGDSLLARSLAERGLTTLLYDRSSAVQKRLRGRLGDVPGVHVLDEAAFARLPPGSVDFVLVISVVQYLSEADLDVLLGQLWRLLRPGGRLLLADVMDPATPMRRDVTSLLALARRSGFVLQAILGLIATYFSPYRRLRKAIGLTSYSVDAMLAKLAAAGLSARRLPANVGPSAHRLCFLAERPGGRNWTPISGEAGVPIRAKRPQAIGEEIPEENKRRRHGLRG
jgi:SAM-dependent methyltransferase